MDPARDWPDLGSRFEWNERKGRAKALDKKRQAEAATVMPTSRTPGGTSRPIKPAPINPDTLRLDIDRIEDDATDLSWATTLKRTFESFIRGERPNMVKNSCVSSWTTSDNVRLQYGEWIDWSMEDR